jgi:hypothetical protein
MVRPFPLYTVHSSENSGQDIIKKHRFDLPPGIENSPADMAKIEKAIQDAFTQGRSTFKKKVRP